MEALFGEKGLFGDKYLELPREDKILKLDKETFVDCKEQLFFSYANSTNTRELSLFSKERENYDSKS